MFEGVMSRPPNPITKPYVSLVTEDLTSENNAPPTEKDISLSSTANLASLTASLSASFFKLSLLF